MFFTFLMSHRHAYNKGPAFWDNTVNLQKQETAEGIAVGIALEQINHTYASRDAFILPFQNVARNQSWCPKAHASAFYP